MATSFIPISLQRLWNVWNIRGFVMVSFFLQLLLGFAARLRKKSTNRMVVFVIWLAYFTADWVPLFVFGLISNAQRTDSVNPPEVQEKLLASWAAFLLIHLGGPDSITAFSLEDNALWLRHLVGLFAQSFAFFFIFLKTLPDNDLVVPTILVAIAGVIKYGERTRALYLASMENLKKSIVGTPNWSLDTRDDGVYVHKPDEEASKLFKLFKGLVVDVMPDHAERSESREFILKKEAAEAYHLMVVELDILYDVFYTKIIALYSCWGVVARTITYYNVLVALIMYCISKKEGFHGVDIWITYLLLAGFFATETMTVYAFVTSAWTQTGLWYYVAWLAGQGLCLFIQFIILIIPLSFIFLCGFGSIVEKSWCENLGAFNLLSHCFRQCQRKGNKPNMYGHMIVEFVTSITNGDISRNAFNKDIWNFIFNELKQRALFATDAVKVKEIFEAKGKWILMRSENNSDLMRYVSNSDYDRSLLTWHVATEICYNIDEGVATADEELRKFSKVLSDYMHYLLTKKSEMMSVVAGRGHIRYHDTCAETKYYCRKFEVKSVSEFCPRVVNELTTIEPALEYKDRGISVLSDACNLVKALEQKDKKWEIISRVWVELLSYAANHCRAEKHARVLSEGGELITIVWLLMAHFDIGPHFPDAED